ncbi:hypothetical protein [Paenibacillus sp. WC2504]|uniref:hypothetical protein n=1 Tax=Paenibacillus sp. WC2504 TaxID=3461403 RepID=UPI004045E0B5
MILTTLLILISAVSVALATVIFWDEIKTWLKSITRKLETLLKAVFIGIQAFIMQTKESYIQMMKVYGQNERGQWHLAEASRTVPESEVPTEILEKVQLMYEKTDINRELGRELKLYL